MHGAGGEDLIIKVPVGTIIRDDDTNQVMADLIEPQQQLIVAHGGRGGRVMPDLPLQPIKLPV